MKGCFPQTKSQCVDVLPKYGSTRSGWGPTSGWKQTPVSSLAAPAFGLRTRYRILEVHAAEAVSSPLSIISLGDVGGDGGVSCDRSSYNVQEELVQQAFPPGFSL